MYDDLPPGPFTTNAALLSLLLGLFALFSAVGLYASMPMAFTLCLLLFVIVAVSVILFFAYRIFKGDGTSDPENEDVGKQTVGRSGKDLGEL